MQSYIIVWIFTNYFEENDTNTNILILLFGIMILWSAYTLRGRTT